MPLFDKKDKSRYATFTRRSLGLGGGMAAVFAVLAGRLYQLQIRDGDQYMVEAEDNRVSERLIAPPRGRIIDRFGVELANNRRNYRVLLVSEQASEGVKAALDTIGEIILLSDQQKKKVLHDIAMNKKFVPVPVAENLSWEDFSRVNLQLPYLPGIQCDVGEMRDYPYGSEMVHVLGYVASVSEQELQQSDDPLMSLPGMRVGKRGIEKAYDKQIRGRAGDSKVEVNAYGRVIRELGKDPGVPGQDVWLSLDGELQRFADQRLSGESAACVVMDAAKGDVLALSSTPGFDPNWFNVGVTGLQWHDLTTSDYKPLLNKAISGTYPPGSTFKTAMALAAVDNGIAKQFPLICTSGRLVEYEGGGEETRSNKWLAELQQDSFIEINPADAADRGITDGQWCLVSGPEMPSGKACRVKALVTERVGKGTTWMPFHFAGWFMNVDQRSKYPQGTDPIVLGESVNTVTGYGYDPVTGMQEPKAMLCQVRAA